MAESEEEIEKLLIRVKKESKKDGLKLNIQKTKIMSPGHITSWQIEGEKVEAVTDFIFLGSNITADSNCSHRIKRYLLHVSIYTTPRGRPTADLGSCVSLRFALNKTAKSHRCFYYPFPSAVGWESSGDFLSLRMARTVLKKADPL